MKKYTALTMLCILLFLAMSYNVLHNRDIFTHFLQKDNRRFENIAFVTSDSKGNIYVIDQYRTRLVKLNSQGDIIFEIDQNNLFQGTDCFFNELTVDESGNIYAVCDVLDEGGYYITKSEIRKYEPDGSCLGVLQNINYTHSGTKAFRGNYIDLKVVKDDLCYYITTGNITKMYKLSLKDGRKSASTSFLTGDADNVFHVTGSQQDVIFYETKDRKIYRTDNNGMTREIFNGNNPDLAGEIIPRRLVSSPDGSLYFLDVVRSRLYRILPDKDFNINEYISLESLIEGEKFGGSDKYTALMPVAGGKILVADQKSYVILDKDGALVKASSIAGMTFKEKRAAILLVVQAVLCVLLMLAIILILYFKVLNRRLILFLKYALVLIPSFIIMMSLVGYYMYSVLSESSIDNKLDKLAVASQAGSILLNGDLLDNIKTPGQCTEPAFKSLLASMDKILQADSGNQKITGMYATIYKKAGDRIYVLYDYDWNSMPFTLYADNYKTSDMAGIFTSGASVTYKNDADVNGRYMDYISPIYNSRNEIVGAFEAGVYMYSIDNMMKTLRNWLLFIILCSTLVLTLLILATNRVVLNSLSTLRDGVYEMSRGNLEVLVEVNTRDEVGDLGDGFNIMADYIRNSVKKARQTSEAYFRFVPERMLQLLGKESITNIETGDTVKRDMSVMSLNIHSFYSISTGLSAERIYAFINSILEQFGPVFHENQGIVEKYLGAGITAIFPDRAEDAVCSSVRIISIMEELNAEQTDRQGQKLDIGIGLYKGDVMLGTIGEEKRMECTMILDDGYIPQQLCRLSQRLGVSILASESVLQSLENSAEYLHRYMGRIKFEGMAKPIGVYDIFQGNNKQIRASRADTKEIFEEGVGLYEKGQFLEARTCFIDVLRHDREDGAAKIYFYLSDESYQNGDISQREGFFVSNF
ncbi:MAG: HAMP domain-containing protein [Syntrophomonas sp.]